eukprot:11652297-Karenia_brevis.AAC.1
MHGGVPEIEAEQIQRLEAEDRAARRSAYRRGHSHIIKKAAAKKWHPADMEIIMGAWKVKPLRRITGKKR